MFNLHFVHAGEEARIKSAELLASQIPSLTSGNNHPLILVGDLNDGRDSQAYKTLLAALCDAACVDGCCTADGMMPNGTSTFCGFRGECENTEIVRGRRTGKGAGRAMGAGREGGYVGSLDSGGRKKWQRQLGL